MAGEKFTDDLRRTAVTWWIFAPEAFADPQNPTLAEWNSTNERLALNITCAVDEESTTYTIGSSDLDERYSFCDGAGKSRPKKVNPEAVLGTYYDEDRNATGIFNKTAAWLRFADVPFYLGQRVGDQDATPETLARLTDDLRLMSVRTDEAANTTAQDDPVLRVQNLLQAGFVNWNFKPTA